MSQPQQVMNLMPGGNSGGTNMAVPTVGGSNTPAVGSNATNPFLPQFPGGQTTPPMNDTINLAGLNVNDMSGNKPTSPNNPLVSSGGRLNGSGGVNPLAVAALGPLGLMFGGGNGPKNPGQLNEQGNWVPNQKDFIKAMHKSGFSAADAAMLFNFLQSGAGFNPAVAEAMIAAMEPGIKRNEADIMEWFGSHGLRDSSSSALAMGDFLGQVQLNEGQIWASMYEQSVQNYMTVLLGGKGPAPQNTFQNLMQFMGTAAQSAAAAAGPH